MRFLAPLMSSRPKAPGSSPRTMFSQTVRLSASMKCWNTIPTPTAMASFGDLKCCSTPLTAIVPSSGLSDPYSTFIRVDLPAPFSPTTAWIVAGMTRRFTWSLATTPGNRLTMSRSSMAGAAAPVPSLTGSF